MDGIIVNQQPDIESLVVRLQLEAGRGDRETIRSAEARIHTHAERISDQRREHLQNIKERIRGAHPNPCLNFFASVFKVFDLLLKPLSAVTGGALKLELGKALGMLKQAQVSGRLLGLEIDGEKIKGAIKDLRRLLQQDMGRMSDGQDLNEKQNHQIMQILEGLEQSFEGTLHL